MENLIPGLGTIGFGRPLNVDLICAGGRAEGLQEPLLANQQMPRSEYPGLGEHDRIVNGSFIQEHVAETGVALDHVFLLAVNQSEPFRDLMVEGLSEGGGFCVSLGSAQPRLVIQSGYVDDECIAFPMANGVSHIGSLHIFRVRPSIRVDEPKILTNKIRFVEDNSQPWGLNNL